MSQCEICGTNLADDLFSTVSQEPVCCICKINHVGGLPTTAGRIQFVRKQLGLKDGEYLAQDNAAEAARIIGRNR